MTKIAESKEQFVDKKIICKDKMVELYDTHDGCHSKVAKAMGCSREYVRQILGPMGLKARGRKDVYHPPKGPSKYTPEYLRELYVEGEGRYYKMAKIAGSSTTVISSAIYNAGLEIELKSKSNMGRPRRILRNQVDTRSSELRIQ